ncbi:hypothetical protein CC79DRAFT_4938 [Sarocladium strictum]
MRAAYKSTSPAKANARAKSFFSVSYPCPCAWSFDSPARLPILDRRPDHLSRHDFLYSLSMMDQITGLQQAAREG